MKKIIINRNQLMKLNEDNSVNLDVQAKSNTTSDFVNAASNPNTVSDINKSQAAGDVNLVINGPDADDSQPMQNINVAQGDTVQNAINTQANDELIRNGGGAIIRGDGLGESRVYSKKMLEEIRLNNMRKNGEILTKKELTKKLKSF